MTELESFHRVYTTIVFELAGAKRADAVSRANDIWRRWGTKIVTENNNTQILDEILEAMDDIKGGGSSPVTLEELVIRLLDSTEPWPSALERDPGNDPATPDLEQQWEELAAAVGYDRAKAT